jgi:hypothetical protein
MNSGVQPPEPTALGRLAAQTAERRAQRDALQALGVNPYPTRFEGSTTLAEFQSPQSGQLLAARAEALFVSSLSAQREYTQIEVAAAISYAIGTHDGISGCAGEVAAAYGEHPETAARRMRWARAVVEALTGPVGRAGGSS